MNYRRIHDSIIERAKHRTLDGYGEWHHVIPRCMGGSDNRVNKVHLTPEEHFVVHQLLVKMYPEVAGLVYAAKRMTHDRYGHRNNKMYGWLKRKFSEANQGSTHPMFGKHHTEATKELMSESQSGFKNPMYGRTRTVTIETRNKLSTSIAGKMAGEKHPMFKRHHTEETKRKMREAHQLRLALKNAKLTQPPA